MTKHLENCSAPCCNDNKSLDTVWVAGEEICSRRPTTELQKKQSRINQALKNPKSRLHNKSWTIRELLDSAL